MHNMGSSRVFIRMVVACRAIRRDKKEKEMTSLRIGRLSIVLYKNWALFEIIKPYSFGVSPEYIVHIGPLTLAWKVTGRRKKLSGFDSFLNIWKIHLYFFRVPSFGLSGQFWHYGAQYQMINVGYLGIVVPMGWLRWVQ